MAALSGSFERIELARSIALLFGSTHSLMPTSGFPVALGGSGGSLIGPLSPGSAFTLGSALGGPDVLPEGLLARGSPAELLAHAPSREHAARSATAVRPTGPTAKPGTGNTRASVFI